MKVDTPNKNPHNTPLNPPRQYSDYREPKYPFKNKGIRMPLEVYVEHNLLNLTKYSPQVWPEVIHQWKTITINNYLEKIFKYTTEEMVRYLETTLGNTAKRAWDNFKASYENEYRELLSTYFINLVTNLSTGNDPNMRSRYQQSDAVRKLEQLTLKDWAHVILFLNDYIHYASLSRNIHNEEFHHKLISYQEHKVGK